MKKIYIILLNMLMVFYADAQITVTQSDLPAAGWGFINATDTNYSASVPAGGAGQSWNYAGLLNASQDSLLFINAAGTPYAGQFPLANLATNDPQTGAWAYFISNSTGLYLNGGTVPQFGSPLVYDPAQMFIPVPLTYGNTYSGYSRAQIDTTLTVGPNTYPARFVMYTNITVNADGYGTLILPTGTTNNTLRVKHISLTTDSIYVDLGAGWQPLPFYTPTQRQTTNFRWLRNGGGTLLLEIQADSLGQTANRSSYLLFFAIVGVNEITNNDLIKTFPNPASDRIRFGFDENPDEKRTLTILDPLGKKMEEYDITGMNSFTMATSHLPDNIYFYTVKDTNGNLSSGRFTVVH